MDFISRMIVELETTSDSAIFDKKLQRLYEPKYTLAGASYI